MFDATKTRLETRVPDLAGRVQGAADYSKARRSGRSPGSGLSAFLLPLALLGGKAEAATGLFLQDYAESLGVVLVLSSVDRHGTRALDRLDGFLHDVIAAFAGWSPDADTVGVYELTSGRLIDAEGGALTYEIIFSITDQLRVTP